MKVSVIALVALVLGQSESSHVIPLGVTVGITPYSHPVISLYHSQDVYGQYAYGYSTPTSTKSETKTADGVTQGGYSYIDSNGILQSVQYIADPIHGFRVAATNLPQDLPDVAHAKAKHLADFAAVQAEHAQIAAQRTVQYSNPVAVPAAAVPQVNLVQLPQPVQDLPEVVQARAQHLAALQAAYAGANSQPVQDLPEVARARAEHLAIVEQTKARDAAAHLSPVQLSGNVVAVQTAAAPVAPVVHSAQISYTPALVHAPGSSQYHAQDGLGQYSYGYVGPLSAKSETKTADGVTRGGYSYIDANGNLQTVNYISDPVHGFRVAATNLPAAPSAPVVVQKQAVAAKAATAGLYTHEIYY
ncbi:cuticular protein [Asbolus verrucosus]|uniref:Cuticular protein n=1 Tax=Asbolus verrucosus TaxID=1661398 RepID=A0A482VMA0_ASBVE|nr:cuticular protein [Asbolus verrucosus]